MILIYTEKLTPRIEYISRLIFTTILKKEVSFTGSLSDFQKSELHRFNYSDKRLDNIPYIKPHPIMHSRELIQPDIQLVRHNGESYFFESSANSDLPFDPLAASFYLVTRYEEYLCEKRDEHNRFPAEESILFKHNLLKKPVVNIWANMLTELLKKYFPEIIFPEPKFEFLSTIDIDNAWAFSHKGFFRSCGALGKALLKRTFPEVKSRLKVWLKKEKDPYDTYDFIHEVFRGNEDKVLFFFLLGNYGKLDKNLSWKNRHLQELIAGISSKYSVGIHPSYYSGEKRGEDALGREIKRLEQITGKKIRNSRQHFLRLSFPQTYRSLIKAGIHQDYSMGYPSQPGFRAGICTPYFFYDLKREKETLLKIIPFQVMDVTFQTYMKVSPDEAWNEAENLMREVKNVGGTFAAIWHNESLNNTDKWEGFRDVFIKMNESGFKWADE